MISSIFVTARRDTQLIEMSVYFLFLFIQYYCFKVHCCFSCLMYFFGAYFIMIYFVGTNDLKNDFSFKCAWMFGGNHYYCCCSLYPGKLLLPFSLCVTLYSNVSLAQIPLLYRPSYPFSFPFPFSLQSIWFSGRGAQKELDEPNWDLLLLRYYNLIFSFSWFYVFKPDLLCSLFVEILRTTPHSLFQDSFNLFLIFSLSFDCISTTMFFSSV